MTKPTNQTSRQINRAFAATFSAAPVRAPHLPPRPRYGFVAVTADVPDASMRHVGQYAATPREQADMHADVITTAAVVAGWR